MSRNYARTKRSHILWKTKLFPNSNLTLNKHLFGCDVTGRGSLGFWPNSFEGVLKVGRKEGSPFSCIIAFLCDNFFRTYLPPPVCIYTSQFWLTLMGSSIIAQLFARQACFKCPQDMCYPSRHIYNGSLCHNYS